MDNVVYQLLTIAEVEQDLIVAIDWYHSQQSGLAERFLIEYEIAVQQLKDNPFIYQRYNADIRKVKLKNFPYLIFYMVQDDKVIILAVFHGAKNPFNIISAIDDRH